VLDLNQPTGAICGLPKDAASPAGPTADHHPLPTLVCWLSRAGNLWVPLVTWRLTSPSRRTFASALRPPARPSMGDV